MSEYNADELAPPTWLNKQFVEKIIRASKQIQVPFELDDILITPASLKGDHYASVMFRAAYSYNVATTSVTHRETIIIKTMPNADSDKAQHLGESHLFETEMRMYQEIIPALEAVWQQHGEVLQFAGKLLYAALTPHPVIVLEDLCQRNYDILRARHFNYAELRVVLTKLAKWHAASYKLTHEATCIAKSIQQMQHGLFTAKNLIETDFVGGGMRNMLAAMEKAGGFEKYLPKLRALEPRLIADCVDMNFAFARGIQGPIYVLNHGDFHTKNIMVRRNGEQFLLEDILFIDFQASFYGTSTYDLQYVSFTSFDKELRDEKREELTKFYFNRFCESLEKLEFKGELPTFANFQGNTKRWRCFEFYLITTILPVTLLSPQELNKVDINQVFNCADYRSKLYEGAQYMAYLRQILPQYLAAGYLD